MHDEEVHGPASKFWNRRKILLIFLGPPVLIVIGVLIFLAAYDEKLQPFEDLVPETRPMAGPERNGFVFLISKWDERPSVPYKVREAWHKFAGRNGPWEDVFADIFNPKHQEFRRDLADALALPEWRDPGWLVTDEEGAWSSKRWEDGPLPALESEAWMKAKTGDLEYAVSLISDMRRMARRQIQGSREAGSVTRGLAWDRTMAEFTCLVVAQFQPNDNLLAGLSEIWRMDPIFTEDLVEPIRNSCVQFRHQFDDEEMMDRISWPARVFLLKRNKTVNLHHREMRTLMADGLRTGPHGLAYESDHFSGDEWRPGLKTADNLVGVWMARDGIRITGSQLNDSGRDQLFKSRALRVWLAIRRWQLLHPSQKLASLAELPPDLQNSIPSDPWDGQPLRWHAADQLITGLGSDWKEGPATFRALTWFNLDPASPALRLVLPPLPVPAVRTPKPTR
ncbi:MAG: hypothetical protein V4726_02500 [Verrucomicrobiota bacterium]